MLYLRKFIFLLICFFSVNLLSVSGQIIFDQDKFIAQKEFHIDVSVSYKHSEPVALKGAPELKLPEKFKINKVSSFSSSGSGINNVVYRYYVFCSELGEYTIGPAIVTYYTKTDQSKNDDKNLSLAEITEKAVKGEKEVDTHTFLVKEEKIEVTTINYLYILIGLVLILIVVSGLFFGTKTIISKRKMKKKTVDLKIDYKTIVMDIEKLRNEGDLINLYQKICEIAKKYSFGKSNELIEKKEQIKFANLIISENEIESDIRSLELFLKNAELNNN